MVIDSFDIEGISNIEHVRLDVGEMNALVAPNGYGKSNVLSAISFGLDFLNASAEGRRQSLRWCSLASTSPAGFVRFL